METPRVQFNDRRVHTLSADQAARRCFTPTALAACPAMLLASFSPVDQLAIEQIYRVAAAAALKQTARQVEMERAAANN